MESKVVEVAIIVLCQGAKWVRTKATATHGRPWWTFRTLDSRRGHGSGDFRLYSSGRDLVKREVWFAIRQAAKTRSLSTRLGKKPRPCRNPPSSALPLFTWGPNQGRSCAVRPGQPFGTPGAQACRRIKAQIFIQVPVPCLDRSLPG